MALTNPENDLACIPSCDTEFNIETIKARNRELSIDVSILKRLVYMLNVELELRDSNCSKKVTESFFNNQRENEYTYSRYGKILQWDHEDITVIDPLLRAFQQTKDEKDQLIVNYKRIFDELSNRCKELVLENDDLRGKLQETRVKAESSYAEWQKLHRDYDLMKEHNQLLTRQVKLFQNKIKSIESVYRSSLKQYENERQELKQEYDSTKTELLLLKGRFSAVTHVNSQLKHQNNERNDVNFYNMITKEIKDLSVELKLHNSKDIDCLRKKITDLEDEKSDLDVQLVKLSSERDHLKGYVSAVELEAKKVNARYEELEKELNNARKSQGDAKKQIIKCMAFIRELISVHNLLLKNVNESENFPDFDEVS